RSAAWATCSRASSPPCARKACRRSTPPHAARCCTRMRAISPRAAANAACCPATCCRACAAARIRQHECMTAHRLEFVLPDAEATRRAAAGLAAARPPRAGVLLHGDLGAGKSTLARGWLRALGVEGAIRSPTYTLVEHYPLPAGGKGLHLDLYRIGDARELDFLGLDDAGASLWLVEWPERGAAALPAADLEVMLALAGDGRQARLRAGTARGRAWLDRLRLGGQLQAFPESNLEEGAAGPG